MLAQANNCGLHVMLNRQYLQFIRLLKRGACLHMGFRLVNATACLIGRLQQQEFSRCSTTVYCFQ